jgi:hypothetical protein
MANEYSIMLNAMINDSSIIKEMERLANKYTLTLKAAISGVAETGDGATGGATQATKKLGYASAEAQRQLVGFATEQKNLSRVTKESLDPLKKLETVTVSYKDAVLGNVVTTTRWDKSNQMLATSMTKTANVAGTAAKETQNFTDQISNNILKVMQWAVATSLIYGSLKKIREGVEYVSDLNKEMTNARIVTGMTADEATNLAGKYNDLARKIGVTTLEISRASLEWFRQGKTVEEAMELTKQSMVMAKLGNLDAAQSTEYLTSIINGFKLKAEEVSGVIDKLVSLDNAYATSVGKQNCRNTQ